MTLRGIERWSLVGLGVVLGLMLSAAPAQAGWVKLVWAGNDDVPSGGWCSPLAKTVAQGGTKQVRLQGAMDTTARSTDTGKYKIMTQADKFEFGNGTAESQAVTFTQSAVNTTLGVKAKSGAATAVHLIEFAALDSGGNASERKSCKIEVTAGTSGVSATLTVQPASPGFVPVPHLGQDVIIRGNVSGGLAATANSKKQFSFYKGADLLTCSGGSNPAQTTNTFATCKPPLAEGQASTGQLGVGTHTLKVVVKVSTDSSPNWGGISATQQAEKYSEKSHSYTLKVTSKFSTTIAATFSSDRCLHCHTISWNPGASQSAAAATIRTKHTSGTVGEVVSASDLLSGNKCKNCHPTAGWHAPTPSQNMNWTGASAEATCKMIREKFNTAALIKGHLKNDKLIQWAISDGTVPGGTRTVATPGSLSTWNTSVDSWADNGMGCK